MSAEFQSVFARLRKILEPYSKTLAVTQDSPDRYCLTGGVHPKHKTAMPVAWVEIGKNYVSFHHMGVYAFPKLRAEMSAELQARMQGKSCFNFKTVDEKLFKELAQVTARGFAGFRQAGFLSGNAFTKTTLVILIFGLVGCGCSRSASGPRTTSATESIKGQLVGLTQLRR